MRIPIVKSSLLVSGITLFAVTSEMLKDMVLASKLGATADGDAFFLALTIPLILIGAMFQSLHISMVPLFTVRAAQEGVRESIRLANMLVTLTIPVLLGISIGGTIVADHIIGLVGSGLGEQAKLLAVQLARILFPSALFAGLTGLHMNWLNSQRRFAAPASINIVRSLGVVAVVWLMWQRWGVYSAAAGFVIGSLLQTVLVAAVARRQGFRYKPSLDTSWAEIKHIAGLLAWPLTIILLRQSNLLFERLFASFLTVGSISIQNYAFRLVAGVVAVFSTSVFTASLPSISDDVGRGDLDQARASLASSAKLILMFILPVAVLMAVFSQEIVAVVYRRGAFETQAAQLTATVLRFYTIAMILRAVIPSLQMPFYAFEDVRTPVLISIASAMLQILLGLLLVRRFQINGLVMADTLARFFELSVTYIFLRRRITRPLEKSVWSMTGKLTISSAVMGLLLLGLRAQFEHSVESPFAQHLTMLVAGFAVGTALFVGMLYVMRVREFTDLVRRLFYKVSICGLTT